MIYQIYFWAGPEEEYNTHDKQY